PGPMTYHNTQTFLDIIERKFDESKHAWPIAPPSGVAHEDPRWPAKCEGCDYRFTDQDRWQDFTRQIYIDRATGREYTLDEHVPGMMWDASWMHENWKGPDGRCLVVVRPNGREWMIDSQASNCTMKQDVGPFASTHRCWVRHGEPPNITVDKAGRTCAAGAGSIQAGDYHGFLKAGQFT
ncbi:MAG: hypothetical protein ACREUG_12360, partial [Steroidobacteraceae bacterium]